MMCDFVVDDPTCWMYHINCEKRYAPVNKVRLGNSFFISRFCKDKVELQ